ncbi:MAG: hypothetical protein V8S24_04510, partial [Gordonibacter pamelaeae]
RAIDRPATCSRAPRLQAPTQPTGPQGAGGRSCSAVPHFLRSPLLDYAVAPFLTPLIIPPPNRFFIPLYQFVLLATRFNFPSTNPNSLFRFPYSHPFLLSLMFQSFLPSRGSSLIRFSIFRSPPSLSAFLQNVSRETFDY